jgi:hypothetical protein
MGDPDRSLRPRFHDATPIDFERVLVDDYAHSELLEPSRNPGAGALAAQIASVGGFAHLSPQSREELRAHICRIREPMIGFFLRNPTTWVEGTFDVEAIGSLRVTSWFEQPGYANARTIDELLESVGGASYAKLDFRIEAMRGRPIIVGPDMDGPYCVIEGSHRCCEIVRLARRGEVPTRTLPFVLGICPDVHEYTSFRGGVAVGGVKPWAASSRGGYRRSTS